MTERTEVQIIWTGDDDYNGPWMQPGPIIDEVTDDLEDAKRIARHALNGYGYRDARVIDTGEGGSCEQDPETGRWLITVKPSDDQVRAGDLRDTHNR